MIKLVFCVRRLETMSQEEFFDRWLNGHGPMVKERKQALGMVRYVQSHAIRARASEHVAQLREAPEAFDGITECWWESRDTLRATGATEEGRRAALELLEDERKFIALKSSPLWFTEEHVIF